MSNLAPDEATETIGGDAVWSVPYTRHPWDEIVPDLWVGCHQYDNQDGTPAKAIVTNQFDMVVSLWSWPGHGPDPGVDHRHIRIPDNELTAYQLASLRDMAEEINGAMMGGKRVLIRCRAGLNRSALLAAMVLVLQGHSPDGAIHLLRTYRSPYALCNRYFEWYLMTGEEGP